LEVGLPDTQIVPNTDRVEVARAAVALHLLKLALFTDGTVDEAKLKKLGEAYNMVFDQLAAERLKR
jgi:hypothetical protein